MATRRISGFHALLALLLPAAASAIDLDFSVATESEYDSNVFRDDSGNVDDFAFRFNPLLRISAAERRLAGHLFYAPTYEKFVQHGDADNWSHIVNGLLNYQLGPRTQFQLRDVFQATDTVNFESLDPDPTPTLPQVDQGREMVYQNRLGAEINHFFSPRWQGALDTEYVYFDGENPDTITSNILGTTASMNYSLDAENLIGFGAYASQQFFDKALFQPAQTTYLYQVFGSWSRTFDAATTLSLLGGPALIDSEQSGTTLTFFGQSRLTHAWTPNLESAVSYRRSQSDASGTAGTTVADFVTFSTSWRPSQLWSGSINADWIQRKSVNNDPLTGEDLDTTRWSVHGRVSRRLTRRTSMTLYVRYSEQTSKGDDPFSNTNKITDLVAILGFRFAFDTIRL